jgi:hypothetical protein
MKVGSALVLVGGGGERKNAGRNSRTRGARRACAHLAGPPRLVGAAPANVRGQRCQLSEPARVPRGHQGVRGPVPAGGQAEATLLHAHGWRQRYVLRLVRRLAAADHTLRPTARCWPGALRARARVPRVPPCAAQVKCVPRADSHPSPPSPQTRKYSPRSCSPCAPTAATAITWCRAIWAR